MGHEMLNLISGFSRYYVEIIETIIESDTELKLAASKLHEQGLWHVGWLRRWRGDEEQG